MNKIFSYKRVLQTNILMKKIYLSIAQNLKLSKAKIKEEKS